MSGVMTEVIESEGGASARFVDITIGELM